MSTFRNWPTLGQRFDDLTIEMVWLKGRVIDGYKPAVWRYDAYGSPMKRTEYGNTNSKHGWEIDHILPLAKGGTDSLHNLQPLQWGNNRRKGDQ